MIAAQYITLSELQRRVRQVLEERFALPLWVSAEIAEVKVNYGFSITQFPNTGRREYVGSKQYVEVFNEGVDNYNRQNGFTVNSSGYVKPIRNPYGDMPDTDWLDLITRLGQSHYLDLSFSGGNAKTKYYLSGSYNYQEGVIKTNDISKVNLKSNINHEMFKWLKVGANISGNYLHNNRIPGADLGSTIIGRAVQQRPFDRPYKPNGGYYTGGTDELLLHNAVQILSEETSYTDNYRFIGSFWAEAQIIKGLTVRASYNNDSAYTYDYIYYNQNHPYAADKGRILDRNRFVMTNTIDLYANYNRKIGEDFELGAMVGHSFLKTRSRTSYIDAQNYPSPAFDVASVAANIVDASAGLSEYAIESYFARLSLAYKDRYVVNATIRTDGSSRFESDHRWGFFPSASAAWRISEESFFTPARDIVDNLKLRLSVGSLGNQQVSNYAYIEQISTDNQMNYTFDGQEKAFYANVTDPLSSGLTWETVTTYDVGLDIGLLNNRLNFTGDYYIRDTKDMLTTSLTLPSVFGANTPKANCADLRTKGWEISLSWQDEFQLAGKPFSYHVSASVGDYITKITKYHNPDRVISDRYEGQTLGEIWGYHVEGLFKTDREAAEYQASIDDKAVNNRVYQNKGPAGNRLRAGDVRFADLDGNNIISEGSGTVDDPGDKRIIGNSLPRYNYSFRLGFNWMGFDISAFFQGIGRRDWYPAANQASFDFWGPYAFPPTSFIHKDFYSNCWSEDNRNAYFPRPRGYNAYSGGALGEKNDRYLQNLAYLRLKNLTIGYTVPENLTRKIGISRARIYFSGENLCYWSPLKKHNKTIDPELAGSSGTNKANSGTGYAYPKTLSIGVDISF